LDVFELRSRLISDYSAYVGGFIEILDPRIRSRVEESLAAGELWPEPLIQLNPSFEPGDSIDELVSEGVLHRECTRVFRVKKDIGDAGRPLRLHRHQSAAIRTARSGHNYVLTTGTGSGKSLAYIVPIVDRILREGSGRGVKAIIVYPMNALANSQYGELEKFLRYGFPGGRGPVTFDKYTGQESDERRREIIANPPDILLTNYVMLELILTRPQERQLVESARGLQFLVLDELHTYRGRQGADIAFLTRRTRDALSAHTLQCVGTSATVAGAGSKQEQQAEVADIATQLFGVPVSPEHVIGETLRRSTIQHLPSDPLFSDELRRRITNPDGRLPADYNGFVADPLSVWIEGAFGTRYDPHADRLVRADPRGILGENGAARELNQATGVDADRCAEAIREGILAGYRCERDPETGQPPFAFRLHQFISRGDTVYASLEGDLERYLTLHGQQFVPGDRSRVLLPLVFCRECGQDYYCVRRLPDGSDAPQRFVPRELSDRRTDLPGEPGFLYASAANPWPLVSDEELQRLPEDWLEEHRGTQRLKRIRQADRPLSIRITSGGEQISGDGFESGLDCHYVKAPFRFCLNCGVEYGRRQQSDFAKLATLGSEGRSTATTIMSLSAIRALKRESTLPAHARKLLSFTDNRQDASLQAGHFNDFIEIGLLRSALYRAARQAGPAGLRHEELTARVFEALDLSPDLYAADAQVRFQALEDTRRALRSVLGYRLYRDLKRGWRITSPNLEQCGLLEIRYLSLDELCTSEDVWQGKHPALVNASATTREKVARVLLDYMRRQLAIKVDYLNPLYQERLQQQSSQRLAQPWAIDENERLESAPLLYPRGRGEGPVEGSEDAAAIYMSGRSAFGQYLRRKATLSEYVEAAGPLSVDDSQTIIRDLLDALRVAGLTEVMDEPRGPEGVPGYRLPADALVWVAGDGSVAAHDPLQTPNRPLTGGRVNPFFLEFYRTVAGEVGGIEAREHTAQVPYELREEREQRFRDGRLPVLYCSPTMELGVDISELNVVNMRNVPPTPANYAQRSGRAGRNGQPALVFSYCSTGSPHDQYFFRRPERMVAGAVTPPRLDLANEDLVRAHVHAIWLAETHLSLGSSLRELLDLSTDSPVLRLHERVRDGITALAPRLRARVRAERVLEACGQELRGADWYSENWLDDVLQATALSFEAACGRWWGLYRAALAQAKAQDRVIRDPSRSADDKRSAERLRREAEAQLKLLTEAESALQSDFYSYRYFASEGFLPGYSFPRLPLSAYIPGRRGKQGREEFLSRPRFLAIAEFGPRAVIYHEGSRYTVNKVILPVDAEDAELPTGRAKQCDVCGYMHPVGEGSDPDLCERCRAPLGVPLQSLFRLQNVSAKRRDRINSDEEERFRLGYELRTGIRFTGRDGELSCRSATVESRGERLAGLSYARAATLWRLNLGWTRRRNRDELGFVLDRERGYWAKNESVADNDDEGDPMSRRSIRVIPYVEDRRNCLLLEPARPLTVIEIVSLQAALKNAIQALYQLEDNELAAEPLPRPDDPRMLLFYESAEGGAGVLRRLLDEPDAMRLAAREALQLCHFDPDSGTDLHRNPRATEDCEAACYDCLMSRGNQGNHQILDRKTIRDLLLALAVSTVSAAPTAAPRATQLEQLERQAGSELERSWLRHLDAHAHRLPAEAQPLIERCGTRPDFLYPDQHAVIYVDGPHHEYPDRRKRDATLEECLEDAGYSVIRFTHRDDWDATLARYPGIFGAGRGGGIDQAAVHAPEAEGDDQQELLDLELLPDRWQPLARQLAAIDGLVVQPGGDVERNRRVAGSYVLDVARGGRRVRVIDANDPYRVEVEQASREQGIDCAAVEAGSPDAGAAILRALEGNA